MERDGLKEINFANSFSTVKRHILYLNNPLIQWCESSSGNPIEKHFLAILHHMLKARVKPQGLMCKIKKNILLLYFRISSERTNVFFFPSF